MTQKDPGWKQVLEAGYSVGTGSWGGGEYGGDITHWCSDTEALRVPRAPTQGDRLFAAKPGLHGLRKGNRHSFTLGLILLHPSFPGSPVPPSRSGGKRECLSADIGTAGH